MKVLVVDDNRELADTIQEVLEEDGMEVISANDGLSGYSAFLAFRPDVVVTDIQMPGKNGMVMMWHIRAHNPFVRTIYISADLNSYRSLLSQEERQYPVSCFEKPFCLDSLVRAVSGQVTH